MFITKMSISRRTVLRGMGASLALPFLDAMLPALTPVAKAAAPVRRFAVVFVPLGERPGYFSPATTGPDFEFSPILKPLEPFRSQLTVVSGLDGVIGGHAPSTAQWLSGTLPKQTMAEDVRNGTTIDQVIAKQIREDAPLPSLELATEDFSGYIGGCDPTWSCTYDSTLSWSSPTSPLPMEINPRAVFEQLFGRPGTSAQRIARLAEDRSILDSLNADLKDLEKRLGNQDRTRVASFTENVREVEQRIQLAEKKAKNNPTLLPDAPVGIPEAFEEHAMLMYDLMVLALEADMTRVVSFMKCRDLSMRVYPDLDITEPHHSMSHHGNNPEKIANLVKLNTYHMTLFAKFVQKMRETRDGDSCLLDNTLIVYGSGMSESNGHTFQDLPIALVGGGAGIHKGNKHLKSAKAAPVSNLWLDLANKYGIELDKFGVSNGRFEV